MLLSSSIPRCFSMRLKRRRHSAIPVAIICRPTQTATRMRASIMVETLRLALLLAITIGASVSNAAIPIIFTRAGTNAGAVVPDPTNEVGGFVTNVWIDAEDFGYSGDGVTAGGYFPSRPGTNFNATSTQDGYSATETQDFSAWDIGAGAYRGDETGVWMTEHDDDHEPNGVPYTDYKIRAFQAFGPDWCNYTREFTNDNYRIYARVASTVTFGMELALVTPTLYVGSAQSTAVKAGFNVAGGGTNNFFYAVFMTNGVPFEMTLSSTNTLRVSITNGLADFHRLMFVRWTGTPMGFANPEEDPDVIFIDESGVVFYDPEIL